MIEIDFKHYTFVCPYCGREQIFSFDNSDTKKTGYAIDFEKRDAQDKSCDIWIHHIKCLNPKCQKLLVVGEGMWDHKQYDLIPTNVHKVYPDYIPQQIRADYVEASLIIEKSPKAAATLLRRCLQGMIHDFWQITEKNLNAEITSLQGKIPQSQWKAIDGLRKLGNIGAHMENDVNLIIDIDVGEAQKLQKLIELLLEKWYIARHDEEALCEEIAKVADEKEEQKKK